MKCILASWSPQGRFPFSMLLAACVLLAGAFDLHRVTPARAQTDARIALNSAFDAGRKAYHGRRFAEAKDHFSRVFRAQPAYRTSGGGTAAYWLARTYRALGEGAMSFEVLRAGWRASRAKGRFDVCLASAFAQAVYRREQADLYTEASDAYLRVLRRAGEPLAEGAPCSAVRTRVARLLPLLPENVREEVVRGEAFDADGQPQRDWKIKPKAGPALAGWWRGQDPYPATPENERVEEHLRRVVHALDAYPAEEAPAGYDARGRIYVRLGEPERRRDVWALDDAEMLAGAASTMDFPKAKAWYYPRFGSSAIFVFAEEGQVSGRYRLASATDLAPDYLKRKLGRPVAALNDGSGGGVPRGSPGFYLDALRVAFSRLTFHPYYASAYQDLNGYYDDYKYAAAGFSPVYSPRTFADIFDQDVQQAERRIARERAEEVPRQATDVYDGIELLPLAVRTARFLEADGSTRTEVYWTVPVTALGRAGESAGEEDSPNEAYLLQTTAARYGSRHTRRVVSANRHLLRDARGADEGSILPVQRVRLPADSSRRDAERYHVRLQVDQYPMASEGGNVKPRSNTPVASGIFKRDSLRALRAAPGVLEMSDLVPFLSTDSRPATGLTAGERGDLPVTPYPFGTIASDRSLGLYFETYHLAYGADDQTHYTVEYELERVAEKEGVLRFLGDEKRQQTATQTSYSGSSSSAQEAILLDLGQWEGEGRLEATVRITDDVTGRTVERSLRFQLAGPDASASQESSGATE